MNILGISAYYHDSAACILQDGIVIATAQEERFTRKKSLSRLLPSDVLNKKKRVDLMRLLEQKCGKVILMSFKNSTSIFITDFIKYLSNINTLG